MYAHVRHADDDESCIFLRNITKYGKVNSAGCCKYRMELKTQFVNSGSVIMGKLPTMLEGNRSAL